MLLEYHTEYICVVCTIFDLISSQSKWCFIHVFLTGPHRAVDYSKDIDHEIISTVILLPSAESFKKGCC